MVYVKCIELFYFKFFGGIIVIFFLLGFMVVFGFNGLGKLNIFDVLLFCLGLVIFKGMWVEWLLDLVNNIFKGNWGSFEVSVLVIFELYDGENLFELGVNYNGNGNGVKIFKEWIVICCLKVIKGGNYFFNYYINGEIVIVMEFYE